MSIYTDGVHIRCDRVSIPAPPEGYSGSMHHDRIQTATKPWKYVLVTPFIALHSLFLSYLDFVAFCSLLLRWLHFPSPVSLLRPIPGSRPGIQSPELGSKTSYWLLILEGTAIATATTSHNCYHTTRRSYSDAIVPWSVRIPYIECTRFGRETFVTKLPWLSTIAVCDFRAFTLNLSRR